MQLVSSGDIWKQFASKVKAISWKKKKKKQKKKNNKKKNNNKKQQQTKKKKKKKKKKKTQAHINLLYAEFAHSILKVNI